MLKYIQTMLKTTNKNIQAMKATMKIKKSARAIFAAVACLTVLAFTPVHATSVNDKEAADALNRLENYNREVEKTISFFVPVLAETLEEYLAFEAAGLRLEEAANSIEIAARYVSPAVNENFGDYEVKEALDNLDIVNRQIENAVSYLAPSVTE